MYKILAFFIGLFSLCTDAFGQASNKKMLFIIDSVLVIDNPEEWKTIPGNDISDTAVVTDKDTIKQLGWEEADKITFIFTKAFRNRADSIKMIPSYRQLQMKDGVWFRNELPYSGKFINYFYNGKIQSEGTLINGELNGALKSYYPDGKIRSITNYKDGLNYGWIYDYYKTGQLKSKGQYFEGIAKGIHETYFPTGQIQVRSSLRNENRRDTSIIYYSTGQIKQVIISKYGVIIPNKKTEETDYLNSKFNASLKDGNIEKAHKYCIQLIELDSTNADAHSKRGIIMLRKHLFDKAISAFDKALEIEPLSGDALAHRGLARIKKYQFKNSELLAKYSKDALMASLDFAPMPEQELEKVCNDLQQAEYAGFKDRYSKQVIRKAIANYCMRKSGR